MNDKDYKEWYENVEFIQKNIQFYSMRDFVENRIAIKKTYLSLNWRGKTLVQWYLFAGFLNSKEKRIIWDYLNNNISYPQLLHLTRISDTIVCDNNDDEYSEYDDLEQRNN